MPRLSKIGAAALAAFGWTSGAAGPALVTASYLAVAGGGGGGSSVAAGGGGGGGGAGGLLTGTASLNPTLSYTVTVGAGGAGGAGGAIGINGSSSIFNSISPTGGGGGGSWNTSSTSLAPNSGGSGGGASRLDTSGSGVSGQGYAGGSGVNNPSNYGGGGGGGAGAIGSNGTGSTGGNGGIGASNSVSGTATYYAGGGGGGVYFSGTAGTGGNGGGGAGGVSASGSPATANLGGGGGAAGGSASVATSGGNGGSGIVIISYSGAQQFGGGVVTSVGGNTIHTFLTSGTLSPLTSLSASYLIVAGGGGGSLGGAGAGGFLSGSGVTIDTNSIYLVTVGAGGAGATTDGQGTSGANSAFSIVSTSAVGGGGGGGYSATSSLRNGLSGGSGGGGGARSGVGAGTGGTATSGQGNAGGNGFDNGVAGSPGGGGGGAGAVGANAAGTSVGGNGGVGLTSSISGTSKYYAGGGGGGAYLGTLGTGGNGGGGSGVQSGTPNAGTANTGGGGGGQFNTPTDAGGAGGSGVVIISYAGSTQLMAGGTVTITGGNVIHTFTSSGYLSPLTYVNNSLRFRSSASAYLTRTMTTPTNNLKWTFSAWVKRGSTFTTENQIINAGTTGSDDQFVFTSSSQLAFYIANGASYYLVTNAVYRDPAAWYHIVFVYDSANATASNRLLMYVNGTQVTSFATALYPTQNYASQINSAVLNRIGLRSNSTSPFDGYMTNINFIDGQALTPNSFGTFNSYGVWQPITYGGSYGTNGFYLPFTGSPTYAGSFNGSSQYLSLPSSSQWALGTSGTVEAWIYLTSTGANSRVVGNTNSLSAIDLFINSSNQVAANGGSGPTTTAALSNNRWYHIALVYNSGNLTVYINGQAQSVTGTTTGYNITNTSALYIGQFSGGGSYYFPGYISNLRITNTAVYTSNFTPSTTPLTAITGTALLTLQNATIVDNSTNAFTITNTGSVTTAQQIPFNMLGGTVRDYSPANNTWTANNIGYLSGSTLDTMTDVPTLTSATAANYCVLNPLSYPGVGSYLSNANLRISGQDEQWIMGTIGVSTGKWYWEVSVASSTYSAYVGIINTSFQRSDPDTVGVSTANLTSYVGNNNYKNYTASSNTSQSGTTQNTVWGIALDLTAGTISYYVANSLYHTDSTLPTSGLVTFFPMQATTNSGGPNTWTANSYNFGQQPFTYSPPSGFVALNTYNI